MPNLLMNDLIIYSGNLLNGFKYDSGLFIFTLITLVTFDYYIYACYIILNQHVHLAGSFSVSLILVSV
jgi:hypothetical protein